MKESLAVFLKKVAFTTFSAFFFVTMLMMGLLAFAGGGDGGAPVENIGQAIGYLSMKLYVCILPFSLCLGFAARIFDTEKPRALQRLIHFFLCFAAYVIFMDLIFINTNSFLFSDVTATATTKEYIMNAVPFFIGYPVTAGITALGRFFFTPKDQKVYKSILD